MSKDKIEVNMNVYDIPILVEALEEANKEIERLNNIINELDNLISVKIIRVANEEDYQIDINDIVEIKTKLLELKGSDKE